MTCQRARRTDPRETAHARWSAAPLLVLALSLGCASQPAPAPETEKVELPAWIAQGRQTWGSQEEGFFGIGTGEPAIQEETVRKAAAEERAREAVMREFEGWYAAWLEAHSDPKMERAIAASQAGTQVQIVERWIGPDGRTFALAHLKLDFLSNGPAQ
jgi:hypothetical protein